MRFTEIRTLTEEQLNELRMSPSSLKAFINSPDAEGIRAGFEAELVFSGLGGPNEDGDDWEPDMDMDERCRSIEEVVDFFSNDEYGYGLSPREERELRNDLDEKYMEWYDDQLDSEFRDDAERYIREYIEENEWDEDEKIEEHLDDNQDGFDEDIIDMAKEMIGMTSEQRKANVEEDDKWAKAYDAFSAAREYAHEEFESWVEQSYNDQDGYWDAALDQFRDNFSLDDDGNFFSDVGLRWMSDVRDEYGLSWPYMTSMGGDQDGYNEDNAQQLADDLSKELGVKTKTSSGYHSARRDDVTWIFEPDSSLEADTGDMPVEIISPPMPIGEALTKMAAFFKWASSNGAYANSSTGFHMGVSLPYAGGNVDFVKLVLFLGDEHVLREFGRSGNHFCEAAMKKVKNAINSGRSNVGDAMELMKGKLIELAGRSVSKGNFGKYTSINPQNGYIEFRSAGGDDYFEDLDKLQNTLMRYAQAMHVASRPDLERNEYAKKLYKLIAPQSGDKSLELFAKFTSGKITAEELKTEWAEAALAKDAPDEVKRSTWAIIDLGTGKEVQGHQYSNFTRAEAIQKAKSQLSPASSMTDFMKRYDAIDMQANTGEWAIVNRETGNIVTVVAAPTRGEAADQVRDEMTQSNIDFFVRPYHDFEKPKEKLSRRAELAKRIKQGPVDKEAAKLAALHKELGVNDIEPNVGQNFNPETYNGRWELLNPNGEIISHVEGNHQDAENARRQVQFRYENPAGVTVRPAPLQTYSNYADAQRAADVHNQTAGGQFTGQWKIVNANTGEELHRFGGVGNVQADANRIATNWVRQTRLDDPIEVLPVMN